MKRIVTLALLTTITSSLFGTSSIEKPRRIPRVAFVLAEKMPQSLNKHTLHVYFISQSEYFTNELRTYLAELTRIHEICPDLDTQFVTDEMKSLRGIDVTLLVKPPYAYDAKNRRLQLIDALKTFYRQRYIKTPKLYALTLVVDAITNHSRL